MPRDSLTEQWVLAVLEHVGKTAAALVGHDDEGNPADIGSGICVHIGGRFLIATAGHIVRGAEDIAVLLRHPRTHKTAKVINSGFRGGGEADYLDIGWLEIHPEAAGSVAERWIAVDRFGVPVRTHPTNVLVCGYPAELHTDDIKQGVPFLGVKRIGWGTCTRSPEGLSPRREPDKRYDLFLDYPEVEMPGLPDGWLNKAPSPRGLSGGGIWLANVAPEEIWSPEMGRLVAIQCSASATRTSSRGWLRANHAIHWLKMIRSDIPSAVEEIDRWRLLNSSAVMDEPVFWG